MQRVMNEVQAIKAMKASKFTVHDLKEVLFNNKTVVYVFGLQGGEKFFTLQDMMDSMPNLD